MATSPSFIVTKNADGSLTTTSTADPTTVNWAAVIQAIVAAIPAILAILSAFTTTTPPTPTSGTKA